MVCQDLRNSMNENSLVGIQILCNFTQLFYKIYVSPSCIPVRMSYSVGLQHCTEELPEFRKNCVFVPLPKNGMLRDSVL